MQNTEEIIQRLDNACQITQVLLFLSIVAEAIGPGFYEGPERILYGLGVGIIVGVLAVKAVKALVEWMKALLLTQSKILSELEKRSGPSSINTAQESD